MRMYIITDPDPIESGSDRWFVQTTLSIKVYTNHKLKYLNILFNARFIKVCF